MSQPNRLAASVPPEFANPLIDRTRPIRFTVNGVRVEGYEGDTVLSALLANGILSAGTQGGFGVALDEWSAPPVTVAGAPAQMPMALCPAVDGAAFHTVAASKTAAPFRRLLARGRDSLDHDLDAPRVPGSWIDAEPDETRHTDILIVGGGVTGMAAALEAARGGSQVTLVERDAVPGGMAVFFGKTDGETPPEEITASLAAEIAAHPAITVLVRAEMFDLSDGIARVVQVVRENGLPRPRVLAIGFSGAVLATGTEERLPIFPGNRLPRVVAAGFAWRMARQYGVWPGETFHLHTATNAGYRLAILGSESGKTVLRATDPRPDPRTRFIEFCKAYGFRLGWGTAIASVRPERNRLVIGLDEHQLGTDANEPAKAHALIVAGGWQPTIGLWLLAGGATSWDGARGQLIGGGSPDRVVLAGSVTGIAGTTGCIESGKASIGQLRDGKRRAVADPRIDEIHESRDGEFSVRAPASHGLPPAWLGPSRRAAMTEPPQRGIATLLPRRPGRAADIRAANIADISGAIAGGVIAPPDAPGYSAQWHILPQAFKAPAPPAAPPRSAPGLPGYLNGRFGLSQAQWRIEPDGVRAFEPGCLIFINTDETHPANAIGTIVSGTSTDCVALMARTEFGAGDIVYVRDGAACTPARLRGKV